MRVLRQLLIGPIVRGELKGDFQHVLAEQGDSGSAVGLFQISPGREWRTAVENADIVEPEKPTFEQTPAETVLAVDPPA